VAGGIDNRLIEGQHRIGRCAHGFRKPGGLGIETNAEIRLFFAYLIEKFFAVHVLQLESPPMGGGIESADSGQR
jgi:hypothetical protein